MKKSNFLMLSAFAISLIGAFAFKDANTIAVSKTRFFNNQNVYEKPGCATVTSCSNNPSNPLCTGVTMYNDKTTCSVVSSFQYTPISGK